MEPASYSLRATSTTFHTPSIFFISKETFRTVGGSASRLAALPPAIGRLSRLRELHLRNNALGTLPDSIVELRELRYLDLRGNPLTHLPDAIATLPRLDKLDLRWVTTLPPSPWLASLEGRGCLVYR